MQYLDRDTPSAAGKISCPSDQREVIKDKKESWYQSYSKGDVAVRPTVATALNDRRMYRMPIG